MLKFAPDGSFQTEGWDGISGTKGVMFDAKTGILYASNVTFSDQVKAKRMDAARPDGIGGA